MKEKFFECEELGRLEIENVLFSSNYPILFTCRNERNELYLCVCCQANESGKKWLLAETDSNNVICMLKNETTMREAFLLPHKKRYSILISNTQNHIKNEDPEEWNADNSIDLPDSGEFLNAEKDEFKDYITMLNNIAQLDEKPNKTTNPFYSEENQRHLQLAIADLEAGKGQVHELIDVFN